MWILVIVLLAAPTGLSRMTVLNTFATYEDCKPERDRVGFAMAESYPEENTFLIECTLREHKPLLQAIRFEQKTQHPATLVADALQAPVSPHPHVDRPN